MSQPKSKKATFEECTDCIFASKSVPKDAKPYQTTRMTIDCHLSHSLIKSKTKDGECLEYLRK